MAEKSKKEGEQTMSYAKRVDDNHKEVVTEVRRYLPEATVRDLSGSGKGIPDLLIGWQGINFLFEIKDPEKPASARSLTEAQKVFHGEWQGQVKIAHSATEICAHIARYLLKKH